MENRTRNLSDDLFAGVTDGVLKKFDANRGGVVSSSLATENVMHSLQMQYGACQCTQCLSMAALGMDI